MARRTETTRRPSDGAVVTIRQLSWLQLRAARQLSQQESARNLVAMGGAEFARAFAEMRAMTPAVAVQTDAGATSPAPTAETPAPAGVAPVAADALDGHDLFTVLLGGLPDYDKARIEDLDEDDAVFLGRAILGLTPKPRTEDEEKNGIGPSTSA